MANSVTTVATCITTVAAYATTVGECITTVAAYVSTLWTCITTVAAYVSTVGTCIPAVASYVTTVTACAIHDARRIAHEPAGVWQFSTVMMHDATVEMYAVTVKV